MGAEQRALTGSGQQSPGGVDGGTRGRAGRAGLSHSDHTSGGGSSGSEGGPGHYHAAGGHDGQGLLRLLLRQNLLRLLRLDDLLRLLRPELRHGGRGRGLLATSKHEMTQREVTSRMQGWGTDVNNEKLNI